MNARFARQQALGGWDQKRLTEATIGIAGSGAMAFLCALMAAAMGFGRLVLLHGGEGAGMDRLFPGLWKEFWDTSWATFLQRVNPRTEVHAFPFTLNSDLVPRLRDLDGLIVASNSWTAQKAAHRLSQEADLPVIAGCAAGWRGAWGPVGLDAHTERFHGKREFAATSQVVAGLLVEEMRKRLLPLPGEQGPARQRSALCLHGGHTRPPARLKVRGKLSISLVGAGALGTWFGLGLGLSGLKARLLIFDEDRVDETNLNRQVLFFDAVGEHKAPILAARLQALFPRLSLCGYGMRVNEGNGAALAKKGMLAACPDNFAVRALLNRVGRQYGQPLLSGGTSATGGSCAVYAPGRTACLSCRMRIDELAQREQAPQGCGEVAEPSVVTSNAVTGGLMVLSLLELLVDRPPAEIWEYDGTARHERIGLRSGRPACDCHLG